MIEHQSMILVIDNDPEILMALESLLERQGHQVITAYGGKVALEVLPESDFDLVLLDDYLPDVPSGVVVKALLRMRPHLPFILMQPTPPDHADRSHSLRLGASGIVCKRAHHEIKDVVSECLKNRALDRRGSFPPYRISLMMNEVDQGPARPQHVNELTANDRR